MVCIICNSESSFSDFSYISNKSLAYKLGLYLRWAPDNLLRFLHPRLPHSKYLRKIFANRNFRRCDLCGTSILNPMPSSAILSQYYEAAYWGAHTHKATPNLKRPTDHFKLISKYKNIDECHQFLDFGAGQCLSSKFFNENGAGNEGVTCFDKSADTESICLENGFHFINDLDCSGQLNLVTS